MQSGMHERNEIRDPITKVRNLKLMGGGMRILKSIIMVFFAISIVVFIIDVLSMKIN